MNNPLQNRIQFVIAFCLGALLLYTGIQHIRNPQAFLAAVLRYNLLPHDFAALASTIVPYIEVALGATILTPETRRQALVAAGGLFALFAAAQAYALILGLDIGCGCFGSSYENKLSIISAALVLALAMVAIAGFILGRQRGYDDSPNSTRVCS